jgi:hypothetical protein
MSAETKNKCRGICSGVIEKQIEEGDKYLFFEREEGNKYAI